MKISENDLAGLARNVNRAVGAAEEWSRIAASIRPVRMLYRSTGQCGWERSASRDDYDGPSPDRQHPDAEDRRLLGIDVTYSVQEYEHTLIAVRPDGVEVAIPFGCWMRRIPCYEAVAVMRGHLEAELWAARRALETWEASIAAGDAVISPTAPEEAVEIARHRQIASLRAARRRLSAAKTALRHCELNESVYRDNGHDIDAILTAYRRDVENRSLEVRALREGGN